MRPRITSADDRAPPSAAPHVVIDDARLAKAEAFIEQEEGATSRFRGWLGSS